MGVVEVIGVVSGGLAIAGAAYTGYRRLLLPYLRRQIFRPLDPTEPVERDALRYTDVSNGVDILTEKVRPKSPDVVLAVDRGGAIVGGLLAKALNLPIRMLSRVDQKNRFQHEFPASDLNDRKVLLVDDASRTGHSLREARRYVEEKFSPDGLVVAVLVVTATEWRGHDAPSPLQLVDYYAYSTTRTDVSLPWDVD